MKYFIGIDGGGTKSRFLAVDEQKQVVGEAYGETTNLASNSFDVVSGNLHHLFSAFFESTDCKVEDCMGICIGSAGVDLEENRKLIKRIIENEQFRCPITVVNDSLLALAAETGGEPGVVVVSGTGSIGIGMDAKGRMIRCGGWGHIVDDDGSGYWIGKEAIRRALRSYDGRGEKTILEDYLRHEMQIASMPECINAIYGANFSKSEIAKYSLMVEKGAREEDHVCIEILQQAAVELYKLADAVIKKLLLTEKTIHFLTVSGGNILKNHILFKMLAIIMEEKYPKLQVKKIKSKPVMGAVHIAMKQSHAAYDHLAGRSE